MTRDLDETDKKTEDDRRLDPCEACKVLVPAGQLIWKQNWGLWVCRDCWDEEENCGCSD